MESVLFWGYEIWLIGQQCLSSFFSPLLWFLFINFHKRTSLSLWVCMLMCDVDWITVRQDVNVWIPKTCEYFTLPGKRKCADVIKALCINPKMILTDDALCWSYAPAARPYTQFHIKRREFRVCSSGKVKVMWCYRKMLNWTRFSMEERWVLEF